MGALSAPGPLRVCVIGAGPRGTGVLDRLCALATGPVEVHVVDPYPAGPGRIWRRAQPNLLWMNSRAAGVTLFSGADNDVPSLWDWARSAGADALARDELAEEVGRTTSRWFASRPLASAYFSWVFQRAADRLGQVRVHRDRAVDLWETEAGQHVLLAGGETLVVDAVVLAQGHVDVRATPAELACQEFADRHGLGYLPRGQADPAALAAVPAGEPVLLRGLGLTFIDTMVLLTEGRGGKFRRTLEGDLVYEPSGLEPLLYAGSRTGVPYHAKSDNALLAGAPELPRYFRTDTVPAGQLSFCAQLWPLVCKDIAYGHYHELFLGHPDRVRLDWPEFLAGLDTYDWGSPELDDLVARAVPDPADRADPDSWTDPLAGQSFPDAEAFQEWVREHVRADLDRRSQSHWSPDLGGLGGISWAVLTVLQLAGAGRLTAKSQVTEVEGWFLPFMSFLTSGPPGRRLAELLALSQAGVLRFLGPEAKVRAEESAGRFVASSPRVPGEVPARFLIEARLAEPNLAESADALLRNLFDRGECAEEELADETGSYRTGRLAAHPADHRLLAADGRAHPARFAVGPSVGTVHRPGAEPEIEAFGQNDRVARAVLSLGS
ncbi:FAD/NAD(P)-binding protein [Crossiella sp. SN42]|uniref:FAD/NAD(P)-binding protein n=1 Tax=Crossiella sp. SN42 TaxID=2944808 RepID=UPI00207C2622|nr:FAD/NAD(P)-binding protein [Crossiella sp. SN42]MCO1576025.1 FAD/NAD(P)-binding protein [Crossiella sp. SN42]